MSYIAMIYCEIVLFYTLECVYVVAYIMYLACLCSRINCVIQFSQYTHLCTYIYIQVTYYAKQVAKWIHEDGVF